MLSERKRLSASRLERDIAHAEIMIGDSVLMLAEEWPEGGRYSPETTGNSPVAMALQVPDVDAFAGQRHCRRRQAATPNRRPVLRKARCQSHRPLRIPVERVYGHGRNARRGNAPPLPGDDEGEEKKKPAVDPIPKGYSTLTTYLVAQDADGLIDFLTKTFGAEETFRSGPGSEGGLHCEVKIGDSMLMVGGGGAGMKWRGTPMPSAFHIYVPDCDATYARALEAGATSIDKPADQSYGERSATVKDAAGNSWYIATHKGESYRWEGAPTLQPYLHPLRAEPVINFVKRAFGAEELGRHATPGWRDPSRHGKNRQCATWRWARPTVPTSPCPRCSISTWKTATRYTSVLSVRERHQSPSPRTSPTATAAAA